MISKIAKGIIPALTAAVAISISTYLQSHIPQYEAILAGALIAAFLSLIGDEVLSGAKKSSLFLRKIVDKRARFEGDWFVETAAGSRMPYGAVSIDYNADADVYTYSGAAYDLGGQLASEWSCDNLLFDIPNGKVRFFCQTSLKGDSGAQHEAYGWLSFRRIHLRRRMRYARGDGFFTVIGKPELKGEFSLDRLDRRYVKRILGRPYIGTRAEMARVVEAYHREKTNLPNALQLTGAGHGFMKADLRISVKDYRRNKEL